MMRRFLFTGHGRSGTKYAATLMNAVGASCTHEHRFNVEKQEIEWDKPAGESSSFAAPFLQQLSTDVVLFHLVRHPLAVIRSSINKGGPNTQSVAFHKIHYPIDEELRLTDLPRYIALHWIYRNRLIEQASQFDGFLIRIEDFDKDVLMKACQLIQHPIPPDLAELAISGIPRNINARGTTDHIHVDWLIIRDPDLRTRLQVLSQEYGYAT